MKGDENMEEITLEKIDIIRHRAGLNYSEAKNMLEMNNGNVIDTLIYIEQNQKSFTQNISEASNELADTVKDIIKKGNVNRIKIKKDEKVLVDIPVNAGIAAGALGIFNPVLLVVGAVTAVASKVRIEIERPDGRIEVIDDIVKEKAENLKEKASNAANEIKNDIIEKSDEIKERVKDTFYQKNNTEYDASAYQKNDTGYDASIVDNQYVNTDNMTNDDKDNNVTG
jgi:gas vesicle protein